MLEKSKAVPSTRQTAARQSVSFVGNVMSSFRSSAGCTKLVSDVSDNVSELEWLSNSRLFTICLGLQKPIPWSLHLVNMREGQHF